MNLNSNKIDFTKLNGLIPAIIQDFKTREVLMLGFMNKEALEKTRATGNVWFYSRSKERLWMKGEASGNILFVKKILLDCDSDTLLVQVEVLGNGKVCHKGKISCYSEAELNQPPGLN